jgi:hypothetical protein
MRKKKSGHPSTYNPHYVERAVAKAENKAAKAFDRTQERLAAEKAAMAAWSSVGEPKKAEEILRAQQAVDAAIREKKRLDKVARLAAARQARNHVPTEAEIAIRAAQSAAATPKRIRACELKSGNIYFSVNVDGEEKKFEIHYPFNISEQSEHDGVDANPDLPLRCLRITSRYCTMDVRRIITSGQKSLTNLWTIDATFIGATLRSTEKFSIFTEQLHGLCELITNTLYACDGRRLSEFLTRRVTDKPIIIDVQDVNSLVDPLSCLNNFLKPRA